jgi:hypothetical protein
VEELPNSSLGSIDGLVAIASTCMTGDGWREATASDTDADPKH